ncbi:MAG: Mov34/MPN/PAD-1 family protein [Kangiella sp.]|jgi:integrative and conjugative element protein (TIGR02256 family)|uniref:CBASS system CD-NTase/cGAS isopeptidase Cap3 n=1 Tax=Methylophaga sp. TaxID=2024840 RepID=UPI0013FF10A1|nr:Mov34/MPN/PAD-1 family protein [Methylophaga sp.]MBD3667603.1 Mov34/MPN/PAD-1 family protein [Kangiella sp.]MTI62541.1 peptidase [Methylophaga sp.]
MHETDLTFKDSDGNLVVIISSAYKKLYFHRQMNLENDEAAGVLIGERRGEHIIIRHISEPGQGDIRTRFSVNRKGRHHQLAVNQAFYASKGILNYVGEWHTHPEDVPSPSLLDLTSWKKNLTDPAPSILLIIGRRNIWVGKKLGNQIKALSLHTQE